MSFDLSNEKPKAYDLRKIVLICGLITDLKSKMLIDTKLSF